MNLFEVDAAERHEERRASRHASLLASQRSQRFIGFLRQAASDEERALRYTVIEADVRQVVADSCTECDSPDADAIYSAIERHLAGGAFCDNCRCWKTGPKALCECEDKSASPEDEARPSAVGDKASSDSTGLSDEGSGPSMDKSKAGDEKGNKKRKDIDTDSTSGRHKTVTQDVAEPADFTKDGFLDQTDSVAKHGEDVTKGSETSGEKPTKHVPFGKGKQADPVTSHFLTATQIKQIFSYNPPYGSPEHDAMFGNQPPGTPPTHVPHDPFADRDYQNREMDGYDPHADAQYCPSCGHSNDPGDPNCYHCLRPTQGGSPVRSEGEPPVYGDTQVPEYRPPGYKDPDIPF